MSYIKKEVELKKFFLDKWGVNSFGEEKDVEKGLFVCRESILEGI